MNELYGYIRPLPLEFPTHFPQYYSSLKGARFLGEMTASRIRAEKIHKDTGASSRARSGKIKKEKGQNLNGCKSL